MQIYLFVTTALCLGFQKVFLVAVPCIYPLRKLNQPVCMVRLPFCYSAVCASMPLVKKLGHVWSLCLMRLRMTSISSYSFNVYQYTSPARKYSTLCMPMYTDGKTDRHKPGSQESDRLYHPSLVSSPVAEHSDHLWSLAHNQTRGHPSVLDSMPV